jgi:hypothetical protein
MQGAGFHCWTGSFIHICLTQEKDRVKNPTNEFLLPERINELSHNSQEANLSEATHKKE